MIIRSQQVLDKIHLLDKDDSSEIIEHLSHNVERELVNKVVDKLKDHKLAIVKLHKPEFIYDLPEFWDYQCAYRQELEYKEVVQCKDCRMKFPWCQKFRDELGGEGFCPYGKEIEDEEAYND